MLFDALNVFFFNWILDICAAICIILLADWLPTGIDKGKPLRRKFYVLLALTLFSMGFVLHIFKKKVPYYPFGF
jgi:hypothetical protein